METIKISTYPLKLKSFKDQKKVFDPVRKKFVVFTPEEFVRQNIIMHLLNQKKYSLNLMAVEYPLKYMDSQLRCDIVIFNKQLKPIIIIECKAPGVKISQKTIEQTAHYNNKLQVAYLIISNGNETYCCKMDYLKKSYTFVDDIPDFTDINF